MPTAANMSGKNLTSRLDCDDGSDWECDQRTQPNKRSKNEHVQWGWEYQAKEITVDDASK